MADEVAYKLYHALISAGHASWCPALERRESYCRCGRTAALSAYEAELGRARRSPVLSLASAEGRG